MSGNGANPDEMAFLRDPAADPELAELATALRAALVRAPDQVRGAALVPKLAEQARISAARAPSVPAAAQVRSRRRLAARLGIAAASIPLLTAGLAVAGVKLPGPAQSAFERVGVELPNQEEGDAAGGGADGSPATTGGSDAPSGAAKKSRGGGRGAGRVRPSKGSENRNGGGRGPAGRGRSDAAPGHNKPEQGPAQGKAVGKTGSTPPGQANKPPQPVRPVKPLPPAKPPPSSSGKGAAKK